MVQAAGSERSHEEVADGLGCARTREKDTDLVRRHRDFGHTAALQHRPVADLIHESEDVTALRDANGLAATLEIEGRVQGVGASRGVDAPVGLHYQGLVPSAVVDGYTKGLDHFALS